MVERMTLNHVVVGSIPTVGAFFVVVRVFTVVDRKGIVSFLSCILYISELYFVHFRVVHFRVVLCTFQSCTLSISQLPCSALVLYSDGIDWLNCILYCTHWGKLMNYDVVLNMHLICFGNGLVYVLHLIWKYMGGNAFAENSLCSQNTASIVQWLEFVPSKHEVRVRFPVDAQLFFKCTSAKGL